MSENTIDVLLFYGEHFYGFSVSDLWIGRKKNIHRATNISRYTGHGYIEVLFGIYCKGMFCV